MVRHLLQRIHTLDNYKEKGYEKGQGAHLGECVSLCLFYVYYCNSMVESKIGCALFSSLFSFHFNLEHSTVFYILMCLSHCYISVKRYNGQSNS